VPLSVQAMMKSRSGTMFPIWLYVLVAFIIAVLAFVLGQIMPGSGVVFVGLATTMWTACAASRRRRPGRRC